MPICAQFRILRFRYFCSKTHPMSSVKVKKVANTRVPSVGFRSWSRFLAVSLQMTCIINPAVGCHYFPPGLQLPKQPLRGLLPILLLGEQRYNGCKQFAYDCYPTASRLRFEPRPFCAWVQHANHSATEPPDVVCCDNTTTTTRGGATVLKVGGQIFFDPPLFGQWGRQNIAYIDKSA